MKFPKSLILLFFSFLILNCSKDETPVPKPDGEEQPKPDPKPEEPMPITYFIYNGYGTLDTSETDNWVILHDKNGNLLDYQSFESGQSLEFKALDGDLLNDFSVTLFEFEILENGEKVGRFRTLANIPKKSIWSYQNNLRDGQKQEENPLIGNFDLTVGHLPELLSFDLSSYNFWASASGEVIDGNGTSTLAFENTPLHGQNDFILTILKSDGDSKYIRLNDVQNGDDLIVHYDEFLDFDSYLQFNLPSHESLNYRVDAVKNGEGDVNLGYVLHKYNGSAPLDSIKLGYLDTYNRYRTLLSLKWHENSDDGYSYSKFGSLQESIAIPENPTITIENESVFEFKFETFQNFVRRSSYWSIPGETASSDGNFTFWTVESAVGQNPKIDGLPGEIIAKYPGLNLNSLEYQRSTLFLRADPYSSYIERVFVNDTQLEEFEFETITLAKK